MLDLRDERAIALVEATEGVARDLLPLRPPVGCRRKVGKVPPERLRQGDELRVPPFELGPGMVVAVLVTEEPGREHDDEPARGPHHVVQPAGAERGVVRALVLEGEVVHEDHAVNEHRGQQPRPVEREPHQGAAREDGRRPEREVREGEGIGAPHQSAEILAAQPALGHRLRDRSGDGCGHGPFDSRARPKPAEALRFALEVRGHLTPRNGERIGVRGRKPVK